MAAPLALGIVDIIRGFLKGRRDKKLGEQDLEALLIQLDAKVVSGQLELNKVEAAHRNIWVAGWRPGIGWLGFAALGMNYLIIPMAEVGLYLYTWELHDIPQMDTGPLAAMVAGMLGLGGFRTTEKIKGVAK